eukprot:2167693-Pleurochrysis_carterae.AAC.2
MSATERCKLSEMTTANTFSVPTLYNRAKLQETSSRTEKCFTSATVKFCLFQASSIQARSLANSRMHVVLAST